MMSSDLFNYPMNSQRPQRQHKKRTIWEESPAVCDRPSPISQKKARRTVAREALKPIAVGPVPKPALLTEDLPTFTPQSRLDYSSGRPHAKGATELETFKKPISDDVVDRIVAATNAYAERLRGLDEITLFSRQWKDTT
jgi:hypothetical protein